MRATLIDWPVRGCYNLAALESAEQL